MLPCCYKGKTLSDNSVVLSDDEKETWRKRQHAASLYNELGNMRLVSEKTGVPYPTLCDWKGEPWWARLIDEIHAAKAARRNKSVDALIDESLAVVADRLQNGDIYITKSGDVKRVPAKLKDVSSLTSEMMKQQNALNEQISRISTIESSTADLLINLAKEFKKFNKQLSKNNAETIPFKEKD